MNCPDNAIGQVTRELIAAVLAGKTIQQRISYVTEGYERFEDVGGSVGDRVMFLLDYPNRCCRIKPEPVVLWCPIETSAAGLLVGESYPSKEELLAVEPAYAKWMRVELDPETFKVLSAVTEVA